MKYPTSLCEAMVVLSLDRKTQIRYTQYVDNDVYVDDVFTFAMRKQWMDRSESAAPRTSPSTACRILHESVSSTMLSTECLNAEPFTLGPQCLPCVASSNVWFHEVLTKGPGHVWTG